MQRILHPKHREKRHRKLLVDLQKFEEVDAAVVVRVEVLEERAHVAGEERPAGLVDGLCEILELGVGEVARVIFVKDSEAKEEELYRVCMGPLVARGRWRRQRSAARRSR